MSKHYSLSWMKNMWLDTFWPSVGVVATLSLADHFLIHPASEKEIRDHQELEEATKRAELAYSLISRNPRAIKDHNIRY